MVELMRTNDIVLISRVEAILDDAGLDVFVADAFVSAVEGSIGAFPRRILVAQDDIHRARRLLIQEGLGRELGDAV
jgi:hypothetical protein